MPPNVSVSGRTSQTVVRRHLPSHFGGWSSFLVMRHRLEVCPLSRGVMLAYAATPIPLITRGLSLAPASSTRSPIGVPCGSLSHREGYGLTKFRDCTYSVWLRFRLSTGDASSTIGDSTAPIPDPLPFGPSLGVSCGNTPAPLACST